MLTFCDIQNSVLFTNITDISDIAGGLVIQPISVMVFFWSWLVVDNNFKWIITIAY